MKQILLLIVILTIAITLSLSAQKTETGLSIPFEKYTLPNGLTVVLNEDKSDPIVRVITTM